MDPNYFLHAVKAARQSDSQDENGETDFDFSWIGKQVKEDRRERIKFAIKMVGFILFILALAACWFYWVWYQAHTENLNEY